MEVLKMNIDLNEKEIDIIVLSLIYFIEKTGIKSKEINELMQKLALKKEIIDNDLGE